MTKHNSSKCKGRPDNNTTIDRKRK